MRLEQLHYFIEIAKYSSFSAAANQLHISQPSLSQAITNLEGELNIKLFDRSRSGVQLTKIGQRLLPKAQSILNLENEIKEDAWGENNSMIGNLCIATIPSMCNAFLSEVLYTYKKSHPFVRIEVRESGSNQIVQDVIDNRADIGLISTLPNEQVHELIEFNQLLTGTYEVCIGKRSAVPLFNPMPVVIIQNEPMIEFQPSYRQKKYLQKILKKDELNILLSLGYTEMAKKIIADGIAIGFYPDFSIKRDPYVQAGEIIPLEIEDNDLLLSFGWIRSKKQHFSKPIHEFVKILKTIINNRKY